MQFTLDGKSWAEEQFSLCQLGNKSRTRRLIQMAQAIANNPAGSIPKQMGEWSDIKAAYRLFDRDEVTFAAVAGPHWEQTRRCAPGRYLLIGDTTEIDFGGQRQIEGLSFVGNGSGQGFLLHNGLLVRPETREVVGLAGQTIHYRQPRKNKKEHAQQRLSRDRESKVWSEVIEQVGSPPEGTEWVHVYDRGGDNFEIYCRLRQTNNAWVIRAAQLHREILAPDDRPLTMKAYLKELPAAGEYTLALRARPNALARTAKLEVRYGKFRMPAPKQQSPYVRKLKPEPIAMTVVWVREVDPPPGAKPIEWVLYTSLPVESFEDAWTIVEYYELRWLVEEYHKALKTGCQVTRRQLKEAQRLEAMVGLMSVMAVRLLQLKSVANADPDRPARSVVPPLWLEMLRAVQKRLRSARDLTVYQFYRELAKLGGFIGRKSDGEPGWITIWRGWEKLNALVQGAQLVLDLQNKSKKCG